MANFPDTPVSLLVRLASDRTGIRDESGWTRLFELYAPAIRAFAEERGSEDESEDVVRQARGEGVSVSLDDPGAGVEASVYSDAAAIVDVKWRLARRKAAVEWALTKTALSAQSKAVYRAYVMEGHPIGDVAAKFNIPRNSVSQIKTRVERMVAAIENEF